MRRHRIFNKLFLIAQAVEPVAQARIVAALFVRNKMVAVGINSYVSSRLARQYSQDKHKVYNHAEIAAIKNYISMYGLNNLNKCTMYICRAKLIHNTWRFGLAKPCKGCQLAIQNFEIKKTIWTT
jgi:tRNA(Arg) A34 adenosine deaminase TadA